VTSDADDNEVTDDSSAGVTVDNTVVTVEFTLSIRVTTVELFGVSRTVVCDPEVTLLEPVGNGGVVLGARDETLVLSKRLELPSEVNGVSTETEDVELPTKVDTPSL
jgi:hypothetical protein